jgi:hypothetical protein
MDKNKNILEDNYLKELLGEKSNNPFKVPEDYFNNLSDRINDKCLKTKEATLFQKFITLALRPSVSISLGVILIALITFAYIFNKPNENKNVNISSVSENKSEKTAEDYLIENENIDDAFLIEAASDSAESESIFLTNDAIAYTSNDISNNNDGNNKISDTLISKEEIINYLVEENIDPNDFN